MSAWFDNLPVLGAMPEAARRQKLVELGVVDQAESVTSSSENDDERFGPERGLWHGPKAYEYTAHAFGFVAPNQPGHGLWTVADAGNIPADKSLMGQPIKVTLDRIRVADYPGSGVHHVLVDFYAQHQSTSATEHLHFSTSFRVMDGQRAALAGHPLFLGLIVPRAGISFRCLTVNVKNESDERLIEAMQSDLMRQGMTLATTAQPALAPLVAFAKASVEALAKRHRNVPVQEFLLGLDFSSIPMRAQLAAGSYVAIQIPDSGRRSWYWDEWAYDPSIGEIVSRKDPTAFVPFNYLVFGVSR